MGKFSDGLCGDFAQGMAGESGLYCGPRGGQCYWLVLGLPGLCAACQAYRLACIAGLCGGPCCWPEVVASVLTRRHGLVVAHVVACVPGPWGGLCC